MYMKNAVADWQPFKHVRFSIYIIVNKNRNHFFPIEVEIPQQQPNEKKYKKKWKQTRFKNRARYRLDGTLSH